LKNARNNELSDRRGAAKEAKAALLNAFRAAKDSNDPTKLAKQAERQAVAAAREKRHAEQQRAKIEERERLQAEAIERQAAAEAAAKAEIEARETAESDRVAREIEEEAARKAERDRRYASRKARQA